MTKEQQDFLLKSKEHGYIAGLIRILPRKTYNCASFSLMLQVANENDWTCCYYSHHERSRNMAIPTSIGEGVETGIADALVQMIEWFDVNHPTQLNW